MTDKEKVLKVWPDAKVFGSIVIDGWCCIVSSSRGRISDIHNYEEAAWQNAAESIPAAPELECDLCGQPKNDGGTHKKRQGYGDFESIECSWPDKSPIPPASTNSPAIPAKEVVDCLICAPDPCIGGAHRNAMIEDGVIIPGVDKPTNEREHKPTAHKHGWHYGYVTCTCGWAWDSRNALTGSLATQYGLRMFEKHEAEVSQPSDQPTQKEAQRDYLLGRCLPLLDTLAHYGNKQAKELRKEIVAYANAALSHKEKL